MAKNNELIRLAKKAADAWRNTDGYQQAAQIIDMLVEELESDAITQPNEPLMWEEFEAMIDKPVYIIELETRSYWALVHQVSDVGVMLTSAIDLYDYGARELYGKTWIAYRRPPEGEEET